MDYYGGERVPLRQNNLLKYFGEAGKEPNPRPVLGCKYTYSGPAPDFIGLVQNVDDAYTCLHRAQEPQRKLTQRPQIDLDVGRHVTRIVTSAP